MWKYVVSRVDVLVLVSSMMRRACDRYSYSFLGVEADTRYGEINIIQLFRPKTVAASLDLRDLFDRWTIGELNY